MKNRETKTASGQEVKTKEGVGPRVRSALWLWARSGPRGVCFLFRAGLRLWSANRRRKKQEKKLGIHIPTVLAISPTMRCNYNCQGCYSRTRAQENELTTEELDHLFSEAEELGFLAVLVTGGEPFMRDDLLFLTARHKRLLFVIINNGTQITEQKAKEIAGSGNIITLVSVEGFTEDTDARRGAGAHKTAVNAMQQLRNAGALFGFSVTNHTENSERLGSELFIDEAISLGCTIGVFSEYVPCDANPRWDWLLNAEERDRFHERIQFLRMRKPIVLVQFPQDEYGEQNRCTAAGEASLHINSQGGVEPCPFVPVAVDNIRSGGLTGACRSAFFRSVRRQEHLLRRDRYACSLFEHIDDVKAIARQYQSKDKPNRSGKE